MAIYLRRLSEKTVLHLQQNDVWKDGTRPEVIPRVLPAGLRSSTLTLVMMLYKRRDDDIK